MIYILIFYLIGILISLNFKIKLGIFMLLFISIFIILVHIIYKPKRGRFINNDINKNLLNKVNVFILIAVMIMGYIYSHSKVNLYDHKYVSGTISGDFKITAIEKESDYYSKYNCKNVYGDEFILQVKKSIGINLDINDKIYLEGEFKLPNLTRNEGAFNYRRYLNSKKIYGTITVNKSTIYIVEKGRLDFINEVRNSIEKTFLKLLPINYAGIINGMLNGDTKNISVNILEDFKNSGVTHLLAVSGSNIAYIIMFLSLSSNKIFGKYISYYIIIISIIIFIFVSGASASVARAGIMAILNIVAILFSRKSNTINNISLSALILLIINPLTVYDVGFILSFAGTLGIVLLSSKVTSFVEKYIRIKFLSETISITISAQIILLPIMMHYFNTVSILSVITNLLIVPISGFLTILGFITVIIGQFNLAIAKIVAYAIYALISFMFVVTKFFGKITWSNILVPTPKAWMIIIYYVIIFLLLNKYKWRKRVFKLILLIGLVYSILNNIPRNYIKLNMIDVGQGDSIYIETPSQKTILIDGGGTESSDYDIGENIVLPYILDKGKKKIDLIIVSHPHEDHIEGIFTVIEKLKVSKVVISKNIEDVGLTQKLKELSKKRRVEILEVGEGDTIEIDNVYFEILYPGIKDMDSNLNNMSLLIKMRYGENTALFTGDLEADKEQKIQKDVRADILKVGHHGSITSTSENFLRKVNPSIALISVGEDNSYGHPSNIVIERLRKIGAKIYRTDLLGEIKLKIRYR